MSGRSQRALVPVFLAPVLLLLVVFAYLSVARGEAGQRLALAPAAVGGVLHPVAGGFKPDETDLRDCERNAPCFEQAFGNVAFRQGPRRALELFKSWIAADETVEVNCHRIAHSIGSASLMRFHGDVARTFAHGAPTCVSGYYHGILERAFLGISSTGKLVTTARALCESAGMRRRGFLDYQCRHGLGHGLMVRTGYHLPTSLSICARLGSGWDRRACASGAFMENVNTQFGYRSRWLDDEDPLYPCRSVAAFDRRSCYLRASGRILLLSDGDFAKTAETCAQLRRWTRTCFQGLGREAVDLARYGAAGETRELCRLTGSGEADCLFGAARTIANASGARGIAPARALCAGARRSTRAACFSGIGLVLGMLYPTNPKREAACESVAARHARACFRAALDEVDASGTRAWG